MQLEHNTYKHKNNKQSNSTNGYYMYYIIEGSYRQLNI